MIHYKNVGAFSERPKSPKNKYKKYLNPRDMLKKIIRLQKNIIQ